MGAWDAASRFTFDLQGYIHIPGALSESDLAALTELVEGEIDRRAPSESQDNAYTELCHHAVSWGGPCLSLVDHPAVAPALASILGPGYRLDHDYAIRMRWDGSAVGTTRHTSQLHGGVGAVHVTVVWELSDVGEGEGGFACVAGSHNLSRRHQYPWPRRPPWPEESGVRTVPCRAGDALIFTEEMTHATAPYKGKHGRTTLFLKSDPPTFAGLPPSGVPLFRAAPLTPAFLS